MVIKVLNVDWWVFCFNDEMLYANFIKIDNENCMPNWNILRWCHFVSRFCSSKYYVISRYTIHSTRYTIHNIYNIWNIMKNVQFSGKLICLLKGNLKCINNYTTETTQHSFIQQRATHCVHVYLLHPFNPYKHWNIILFLYIKDSKKNENYFIEIVRVDLIYIFNAR